MKHELRIHIANADHLFYLQVQHGPRLHLRHLHRVGADVHADQTCEKSFLNNGSESVRMHSVPGLLKNIYSSQEAVLSISDKRIPQIYNHSRNRDPVV